MVLVGSGLDTIDGEAFVYAYKVDNGDLLGTCR